MVGFGGTGSFAFTFGVVFGGVLSGRSTIPYLTQISQTSEQEASAGYAETPNSEMMRLTSTRLALPQRYIFRILAPLTAILAVMGWIIFPDERQIAATERKPSLDFAGAGLGTV